MMINILVTCAVTALVLEGVVAQSCSLDPDGEAVKANVLVLGSGITGVTAARTLEVNGIKDFIVLEAGDRIGGRIREFEDTSIELGANWIQGLDPEAPLFHPIWREWIECDEDGPDGSITPDITFLFDENGTEINITEYKLAAETFYDACYEVQELTEMLIENKLDDISLREGLEMYYWIPNSTLENFTDWVLVDLCSGIEPSVLSVKLYYSGAYTDFLGPEAGEDAEGVDYLVTDDKGFSFVVECMARGFKEDRIILDSLITTIQTADDCVCVTLQDNKRYCGDYAIITFSIGVLQAAIQDESYPVKFDPPLPQYKQDAINNVTLVHYGKIFLTFNESFWNETEGQQVLGYVSSQRGEYPYYVIDSNRPNVLTAIVTEDLALSIANQPTSATVNEVMTVLRKIYGNNISDPESVIISNWSNDPLFYTSWTAYAPGVPFDIFERLLSPVGRLYFAGESLNRSNNGFTQGGYGSGAYVANNIINEIQKCELLLVAKNQ